MILYVDETECPEYFIVTGLLVRSKEDVDLAFKRFRKNVSNIPIPREKKAKIFIEFKSTLLDSDYKNIKLSMFNELNKFPYCAIYTSFVKKGKRFFQKDKERAYINAISKIVSSCSNEMDVYFDQFRIASFEKNISKKLKSFDYVREANAVESQNESGIQFVDNICSTVRLHKTGNDIYNFYELIKDHVREV